METVELWKWRRKNQGKLERSHDRRKKTLNVIAKNTNIVPVCVCNHNREQVLITFIVCRLKVTFMS